MDHTIVKVSMMIIFLLFIGRFIFAFLYVRPFIPFTTTLVLQHAKVICFVIAIYSIIIARGHAIS